MAKVFAIVGARGTGKTTFVKERLKNVNKNRIMIYDVNAEYTEFYPYPFEDFQKFMQRTKDATNSILVYEEATIFFNNRGKDATMTNILVRSRHTKNVIFLNFHSLRSLPKYILDLINYIVLFKTNDTPSLVEKFEHESLYNGFIEVKQNSDIHYYKVIEVMPTVIQK